jgi:hypothetical protein
MLSTKAVDNPVGKPAADQVRWAALHIGQILIMIRIIFKINEIQFYPSIKSSSSDCHQFVT